MNLMMPFPVVLTGEFWEKREIPREQRRLVFGRPVGGSVRKVSPGGHS